MDRRDFIETLGAGVATAVVSKQNTHENNEQDNSNSVLEKLRADVCSFYRRFTRAQVSVGEITTEEAETNMYEFEKDIEKCDDENALMELRRMYKTAIYRLSDNKAKR